MKKLIIIVALITAALSFKTEAKAIIYPGGMDLFYSNLAPYGTWIELNNGVYCWRPTIMSIGWAPYVEGRWEWTSYGWYWDSYEPFGYIVYHYGRWYYDDYYGWIWIPDDQWAPAWVEWRYDNDYIGWCPLPPYAAFSINIGIHFTHSYYSPFYHWHFVNYRYFNDPYVYHHFVGPKYKYRIYQRTKYRTNYGYRNGYVENRGVDFNYVKSRSGQNIVERRVEIVHNAGSIRNGVNGGRNSDVIRTFIPDRNEINRSNNVRQFRVEKSDRKTSLDVSKIQLTPRENINRNDNMLRRENIQKNERVTPNSVPERKIEQQRPIQRNDYKPVERNQVVPEKKAPSIQRQENKKQERIYYPANRFQNQEKNSNVQRNNTINRSRVEPRKETPRKETPRNNSGNNRERSNNDRRRN